MRIEHPAVPAAQTPEPTLRRAADSTTPVPTPERGTPRQDSVEISEDARGLALRDSAALERLTLIRERVASGFYDTPTVLDAVAARVLASGDL